MNLAGRALVALQTRGADPATVLGAVRGWLADGVALPPVLVPVGDPTSAEQVAGLLAQTGVPAAQVWLEVREEVLTAPGMRAAVGLVRQRCGVRVVVTGVAAAPPGTLGTATDRPGDVLSLAQLAWASPARDRIAGLARQLGWDVWAEDVASPVDVAALAAAGVHAGTGAALAPWTAAEQLTRVLAPRSPTPARTLVQPGPAAPPAAPASPAAPAPPVAPAPRTPSPGQSNHLGPALGDSGRSIHASAVAARPAAAPRRRSHGRWWLGGIGAVVLLGLAVHWAFIPLLTDDKVDQPVANGGHGALARQGFNLTAWGSSTYNSRHARQALNEASKLGANTVAIVVTQYVSDPQATDIHAVDDKTPSDRSLRRVIRIAKQLGFYVSIKPHVDTVSGDWRGDIAPHDFDAFASSYRAFILHYAKLAQDAGAEELVVGTELKGVTAQMAEAGNGGAEINHDVRGVFQGTVGYAANWDEADHVPFWDKVDFIGIDAYYPLSADGDDVDALVAAWQPYQQEALGLAHRYGKPLVFTEAGYQNKEGASQTPWEAPSDAQLDDQAQVNALQALFTAWAGVPELEGIYLWQLYAGNPADLDPGDWSVVGKPAEDTVDQEFGG